MFLRKVNSSFRLTNINRTRFLSDHTAIVDYYIAIRPEADYDGLLQRYTGVTGRSPIPPDFATGYWQCKLRYATQNELLNVTMGFAEVRALVNNGVIYH
jgi:alpha-glucosidase (family GH31 glycosyl hydrolase)